MASGACAARLRHRRGPANGREECWRGLPAFSTTLRPRPAPSPRGARAMMHARAAAVSRAPLGRAFRRCDFGWGLGRRGRPRPPPGVAARSDGVSGCAWASRGRALLARSPTAPSIASPLVRARRAALPPRAARSDGADVDRDQGLAVIESLQAAVASAGAGATAHVVALSGDAASALVAAAVAAVWEEGAVAIFAGDAGSAEGTRARYVADLTGLDFCTVPLPPPPSRPLAAAAAVASDAGAAVCYCGAVDAGAAAAAAAAGVAAPLAGVPRAALEAAARAAGVPDYDVEPDGADVGLLEMPATDAGRLTAV